VRCSPYAAHAAVNIYAVPLHIAVRIKAPVSNSPRIIVLVSPVYAGSCTRVLEKATSGQFVNRGSTLPEAVKILILLPDKEKLSASR
jgi:hypothetical protein